MRSPTNALSDIHVFITDDQPYGYSLTSPQVPTLAFGRPTLTELREDLKSALSFAGAPAGVPVRSHRQIRGDGAEGQEFVLRWYLDDNEVERREVVDRLWGLLTTDSYGERPFDDLDPDALGVYNFVCCLATDTIGWIVQQMNDRGDVLIVSSAIADRMLFTTQIAGSGHFDWPSVADRGWSLDLTVGELTQKLDTASSPKPAVVRV